MRRLECRATGAFSISGSTFPGLIPPRIGSLGEDISGGEARRVTGRDPGRKRQLHVIYRDSHTKRD